MKRFFLIPLLTLMCSVMAFADYVAKIGDEEYETLQAALDAAQDGDEIQLGDDIDDMLVLSINKACSLDLNGHSLLGMINGISAYADITVSNGTITGLAVSGTGVVSLSEVTLQSSMPDYIAPLNINEDGFVIMDDCTINGNVNVLATCSLTMNSGTINGKVSVGDGNSESSFTMNGGTINGDISKKYAIEVHYGNFTMNGGTINMNGNANDKNIAAVYAHGNSTFTMNGGTINATIENTNNKIIMGVNVENGDFTMEDGEINVAGNSEKYVYGVYVDGRTNSSSLTVNGGSITAGGSYGCAVSVWKEATLNVAGGTLTGSIYGIAGNGSSGNGGTTINISGGNITGDGAGIYHPQEGTLNIKGNPVITGETAIQLCAGVGMTGSITGGRFEAYGTDERATKGGDGLIPDGAALSIVNRNYPGGMPQFTIKGGVFLAQHQNAILAYSWDNSQPAGSKHSEWAAATSHLSAREGIFSSDPSAYVPASGYTVTKLNPTPTVYNHGTVQYAGLWQVGETTHEQSYDFTEEPAEYVEISSTTPSEKLENKTYTLNEDQSSKKVEVAANYKLVVSEDIKLNIGNGGLDLNASSQVIVEPGAVVTVGTNGITSVSGTDNLVLQANSEKQAALLIDPDVIQNTQPLATVILSTKARQKSANPWNYIWEYFASPVVEITSSNKPTNNFNSGVHGLFQGESEFITGVYTWGGNDWALVNSWTSLVPFKGYQLTNNSANGGVEYTFKGNLLGNEDGVYAFTSNGYGYFGNSYSAPIVISNFLSALDNTVYERTVWLYDAGADTYVSVNPLAARIGSAKYKDGTVIKEIRSLQAFILNKKVDGGGNAPINYRDAIWNNPRINSLVSAASAPAREQANNMQWTNIYVEANGNKELVTLVEGEDFSDAFDNGADAGKYINNNSMNLYAATNDGDLAIVATDNLANTLISFQAGNATEYTLSFENGNEDYMLRDNVTGQTIVMIEGAEYSFTQAANTTAQARFEVIAIAKMPTALENVEEAAKATGIYTITGQYMGRDFTKLPAGVYVVNGVKIVK